MLYIDRLYGAPDTAQLLWFDILLYTSHKGKIDTHASGKEES